MLSIITKCIEEEFVAQGKNYQQINIKILFNIWKNKLINDKFSKLQKYISFINTFYLSLLCWGNTFVALKL